MAKSYPTHPVQMPLDLAIAPATGRDDLIVSASVALAADLVDRWPDWPGRIAILYGPKGCGKTHLAEIWKNAADACTLDMKDMAIEDAMRAASAGSVILDDLDPDAIDETSLFHLVNAVTQNDNYMLVSARRHTATWQFSLADLASRISAATVVEIGPPDDDLLTQVIVKLFADRQITAEAKVIDYMMVRMERSLAVAHEIVDAMDQLALARGTRITRKLAAEVLGAHNNPGQNARAQDASNV